jgi:putative oxidoreductase
MIKRIAELYGVLENFPLSILQFLLRFCIAMVFWNAGMVKIQSWQPTVALFANEYRVPLLSPELAATLAATIELTCPVLLVFGLVTRPATLPMLGMTFVIQTFVYPDLWLIHLTWTTILLFILTRGPGAISLDHLLAGIVLSDSERRHPGGPQGASQSGRLGQ